MQVHYLSLNAQLQAIQEYMKASSGQTHRGVHTN